MKLTFALILLLSASMVIVPLWADTVWAGASSGNATTKGSRIVSEAGGYRMYTSAGVPIAYTLSSSSKGVAGVKTYIMTLAQAKSTYGVK